MARETSGKGAIGETSEMGKTRGEPTLSTSRLSRLSRASRATVCGAGGLFQHPAWDYFTGSRPISRKVFLNNSDVFGLSKNDRKMSCTRVVWAGRST